MLEDGTREGTETTVGPEGPSTVCDADGPGNTDDPSAFWDGAAGEDVIRGAGYPGGTADPEEAGGDDRTLAEYETSGMTADDPGRLPGCGAADDDTTGNGAGAFGDEGGKLP